LSFILSYEIVNRLMDKARGKGAAAGEKRFFGFWNDYCI
jgi:hypothetical protein